MPNISFDVANSYYNFICFVGMFLMIAPQVFIYFLKDESMWDTYIALYEGCILLFCITIGINFIGLIILVIGLIRWYRNNQKYLDLKQKNETLNLTAAAESEVRKKEKHNQIEYCNDKQLKQNISFSQIQYEENNKLLDGFYKYVVSKYNNYYDIYRNVKITNSSKLSIPDIFDIVLKSKDKEQYIIYDIKLSFSQSSIERSYNHFKLLFNSNTFIRIKDNKVVIAYIVDNEEKKKEIENYYLSNLDKFKVDNGMFLIEVYLKNEIKKFE